MAQHISVNGQVIEFPDGMSQEDMAKAIKANALNIPQAASAAAGAAPTPNSSLPDPMSPAVGGGDNVLSGIGMGMAKVGRGISNGIRMLSPIYNESADFFGLPGPANSAEAKRLDAPLEKTSGGKFGSAVGQAAIGLPTMMTPGANTYAGAALTQGLFGGISTDGDLMERARAALYSGAGGVVGKATGDALGYTFGKMAANSVNKATAATAANAGKDAAAVVAKDAGYVLPPADVNPSLINTVLQGISGKIKTAQTASQRNQVVTNDLVKQQFGIPSDQMLTPAALAGVRGQAGKAYDAVGSMGQVGTTPAYDSALDAIVAPYAKAAAGFPNAKVNPIVATVESLRTSGFDAASGLAKVSELRGAADTAFASGDKQTGKALRAAAGAIEDAIDTHLVASGAPKGLLEGYRNARQTIAQTYTADKALNPATGDINAQVLGARVMAGKPLGGQMATVGQVAASFPKAMQALKEVPNQVSPMDMGMAALAATTAGPAAAATGVARPLVRSVILHPKYQSLMASPRAYDPSATLGLLDGIANNDAFRRSLTMTGGLLASPADQ